MSRRTGNPGQGDKFWHWALQRGGHAALPPKNQIRHKKWPRFEAHRFKLYAVAAWVIGAIISPAIHSGCCNWQARQLKICGNLVAGTVCFHVAKRNLP